MNVLLRKSYCSVCPHVIGVNHKSSVKKQVFISQSFFRLRNELKILHIDCHRSQSGGFHISKYSDLVLRMCSTWYQLSERPAQPHLLFNIQLENYYTFLQHKKLNLSSSTPLRREVNLKMLVLTTTVQIAKPYQKNLVS